MDAYDRLKLRMDELGLSQADLCRVLSMDSGQMSRAIKKRQGLETKWPLLVRSLRTGLDWLVLGEGPKEPEWLTGMPAAVLRAEIDIDKIKAEAEALREEIREIARRATRQAFDEEEAPSRPAADAPPRGAPQSDAELDRAAEADLPRAPKRRPGAG